MHFTKRASFPFPLLLSFLIPIAGLSLTTAHAQPAIAQTASFKVMRAAPSVITEDSLTRLQSSQAAAATSELSINPVDPALVITTGPEADMLSYRIRSKRNPTLLMQAGSTIKLFFVNVDDDMPHDIRFGALRSQFPTNVDTTSTVGTVRLPHSTERGMHSQSILLTVPEQVGQYAYFCSVPGHAASGMTGVIRVIPSSTGSLRTPPSSDTSSEMGSVPGMDHSTTTGTGSMSSMDDGEPMDAGMSGILRTVPMNQEGSGTSWVPAATPVYAIMKHFDGWMLMAHGAIMPRFDHQGGPRGGDKFDAPNMFMAMLNRSIGSAGEFSAHLMMSLDPLTEGLKGYPLLLQTGESYQGVKLVDIQHPHDLFDEVAVSYSYRFTSTGAAFVYLGYPGEPALGPSVFMHRSSGMSNPNAPLSHHWMDATHVTFGVATVGFSVGMVKLEGSVFNGSEPDEFRYDFDKLKLNSFSSRLSFNPVDELSLQVSMGRLKDPEGDGTDVLRSTASAIYTERFSHEEWLSTTLAWGENAPIGGNHLEAFLLESQYNLTAWSIYGRAEYVQKDNAELVQPGDPQLTHDISTVTLGMTRRLAQLSAFDVDLGVQGSYSIVPPSLTAVYLEHPIGLEAYLSIHPKL